MHPPLTHDHVFLDAEGTLWIPRPGRTASAFWADPRPETADQIFEPAPGLHHTLAGLRALGVRLVVVSKHHEPLLRALLARFGVADHLEDVLVNGDKGERVAAWLRARGIAKGRALMVGDRHDLDIAPLHRVGVRAVLVDRPDNRASDAERIPALPALVDLVRQPVAVATRAQTGGPGRT